MKDDESVKTNGTNRIFRRSLRTVGRVDQDRPLDHGPRSISAGREILRKTFF